MHKENGRGNSADTYHPWEHVRPLPSQGWKTIHKLDSRDMRSHFGALFITRSEPVRQAPKNLTGVKKVILRDYSHHSTILGMLMRAISEMFLPEKLWEQ